MEIKNGSTMSIQLIREGALALICRTTRENCCRINRVGHWYYPNASEVGISTDGISFYRNRSDTGEIFLHKHSSDIPAPTGTYCCVAPDSKYNCDINHKLCVNLGEESILVLYIG